MRKNRIDATSCAIEIVAAAAGEIHAPPNVPLDDSDLPFFESVISELPRSKWSKHQLELAALLARAMADLQRGQDELRGEGSTMISPTGAIMQNPRAKAVAAHVSIVLAFRRSLSLHARGKDGEARDLGQRRATARKIEGESGDPSDLIARPMA